MFLTIGFLGIVWLLLFGCYEDKVYVRPTNVGDRPAIRLTNISRHWPKPVDRIEIRTWWEEDGYLKWNRDEVGHELEHWMIHRGFKFRDPDN